MKAGGRLRRNTIAPSLIEAQAMAFRASFLHIIEAVFFLLT